MPKAARPKRVHIASHKHGDGSETSSTSGSETSVAVRTFKRLSGWKMWVGIFCLVVAIYIGALGYLETRVNTPFNDEKVVQASGLSVPERYWGTYRPGLYMGIRSRDPRSPLFGLMWYDLMAQKGVRHWCDQKDDLSTYGWTRHDGVSFGEQVIVDSPHTITTSFVKTLGGERGGQWTVRINVTSQMPGQPLTLIWYAALDATASNDGRLWLDNGVLHGHTPQLGNFKVKMVTHQGAILHKSKTEAYVPGPHILKEKLTSLLRMMKQPGFERLPVLVEDEEINEKGNEINFIPIQYLIEPPYVVDIVYTTEDTSTLPLKSMEYTKVLYEKKKYFDEQFEETFKLAEKGYSSEDIDIAKAAMSNMLGGIGYFYGASKVKSQFTKEPVPYWKAALYSAVPSRSFFPRGFLWDEGFHGLLIGRWSPDIQMDIAAHWIDLINVEGWIPREQILGAEALARVPKEFVVQSNAAANPPMLLITLAHLVKTKPQLFLPGSPHRSTLDRMFTRLQTWYQWFQNSQKGEEPTAFRWRGREDNGLQLNPKTLSSGLDDYPRASHPTESERHVDLRCWMYAAADAITTVAHALHMDSDKFESVRDQLGDEDLLNDLHWSPHTNTYADYGLHSDNVQLARVPAKNPNEQPKVVRNVAAPPQYKLVTSAFGYVSLFPMLLKVLKPESTKLGNILDYLDKPDLLWSPYGLRSLSKSAPLYMKRNSEHDPPYWRGQVWININYLALAALKHYAMERGPYRVRARELHDQLRANVVGNILNEYKRTGYLWEQYSGEDGKGSGCRPFTGWTALVTLIMAEEY